ncbi:MAG: nucleoside hydrolase [Lachnospiraceae bacterium]|jgi:purine nucleosidase|nr:nucleoside hydrolase [Lachnospiraceae bacterium]
MFLYEFTVPYKKQYRVIVHTDCKNEADDQFTVAHALMTPKFDIKAIIAGHFEKNNRFYGEGNTMQASFEEVEKIVSLMGVQEEYAGKLLHGATFPLADETTPNPSEGAQAIIEEAMKDDERRLFILLQGCLTDLAAAILMEPKICDRLTAVWIGGGMWPEGGQEFNLWQDVHAANVVFKSPVEIWQIPLDTFKRMAVSLAELQLRVKPYGKIGNYLFTQMVEFNDRMADIPFDWPHGESWGLADESVVAVLLEELQSVNYDLKKAPYFREDLTYVHGKLEKEMRVYHTLNTRLTMEDFYAKLALNFPTPDA